MIASVHMILHTLPALCACSLQPRQEPPQNPNSAKKMLFFHGNFYMVGTGNEISFDLIDTSVLAKNVSNGRIFG